MTETHHLSAAPKLTVASFREGLWRRLEKVLGVLFEAPLDSTDIYRAGLLCRGDNDGP